MRLKYEFDVSTRPSVWPNGADYPTRTHTPEAVRRFFFDLVVLLAAFGAGVSCSVLAGVP
jgi:hypothetical protein